MKKLFIKFKAWFMLKIKGWSFDNKLFAKGINELEKVLIKELEAIDFSTLESLALAMFGKMKLKFKKLAPILTKLEPAVADTLDKLEVITVSAKLSTEERIKVIGQEIIKWYDDNL